jgi:ribonuclease HI
VSGKAEVARTTVYTDGACIGNPGPGGWAWAVPGGGYASGVAPATTNQRMELTAALQAARSLPGPLLVVSDSTYVVNCFKNKWYVSWEKKGWRGSNRQPVANQDLWRPLIDLFHADEDRLTFQWVKGHSSDAMNDVVDRLATEAARTQQARSGDRPPTSLGAPDRPGGRVDRPEAGSMSIGDADRPLGSIDGVRSARHALAAPTALEASGSTAGGTGVPARSGGVSAAGPASTAAEIGPGGSALGGHRVVVLGHRPPEIGGYGDNPVAAGVRAKMAEILAGLEVVYPELVVLTGLGLGAEQLGAQAATDAGVPYVVVLAFPDPDRVWPAAAREAYRHLVAGAAETVVLSTDAPATKREAGMAIGRRNRWLTDQAHTALVVWDGQDRSLAAEVATLERRLPDEVWVIPPTANSPVGRR